MKEKINDYDDFMKKLNAKDEIVKNAQIEAYLKSHSKNPNPFIVKEILENNMDGLYELFENIKSKCEDKEKKSNAK